MNQMQKDILTWGKKVMPHHAAWLAANVPADAVQAAYYYVACQELFWNTFDVVLHPDDHVMTEPEGFWYVYLATISDDGEMGLVVSGPGEEMPFLSTIAAGPFSREDRAVLLSNCLEQNGRFLVEVRRKNQVAYRVKTTGLNRALCRATSEAEFWEREDEVTTWVFPE